MWQRVFDDHENEHGIESHMVWKSRAESAKALSPTAHWRSESEKECFSNSNIIPIFFAFYRAQNNNNEKNVEK